MRKARRRKSTRWIGGERIWMVLGHRCVSSDATVISPSDILSLPPSLVQPPHRSNALKSLSANRTQPRQRCKYPRTRPHSYAKPFVRLPPPPTTRKSQVIITAFLNPPLPLCLVLVSISTSTLPSGDESRHATSGRDIRASDPILNTFTFDSSSRHLWGT